MTYSTWNNCIYELYLTLPGDPSIQSHMLFYIVWIGWISYIWALFIWALGALVELIEDVIGGWPGEGNAPIHPPHPTLPAVRFVFVQLSRRHIPWQSSPYQPLIPNSSKHCFVAANAMQCFLRSLPDFNVHKITCDGKYFLWWHFAGFAYIL